MASANISSIDHPRHTRLVLGKDAKSKPSATYKDLEIPVGTRLGKPDLLWSMERKRGARKYSFFIQTLASTENLKRLIG